MTWKIFSIALLLLVSQAINVQAAPKESLVKESLVLAIGGESDNGFDPISGWGSYGNPLFQSTLLRRGADLETLPDLAKNWALSADQKTWTITLQDDIQFSNGEPLTAHDVAFTFHQAKSGANALDLSMLETITPIDPLTIEFQLSKPWVTFMEAFYTLGIVPEKYYNANYSREPIGSGPYKLIAWNEGEQLIVEQNPLYYGPKSPFERITFLFTNADSSLAAAYAGAVDLVAVPSQVANQVPPNFKTISIKTVDNRGISLPFTPPQTLQGQKVGNAVTADLAIRQAMNIGLDRQLMIDVALQGHGTPAFGPADNLPWAGHLEAVTYDLAAAKQLLTDAGWEVTSRGIREKNGGRAQFNLYYLATDSGRQALAETAAELLRPLGIEVTPKGGSWEAINQVMHSEPVLFGFGSHSPYEVYSIYSSTLAGIEYMNPTYYQNEEVDRLFNRAQTANSIEESTQYWSKAADYYGSQGDIAWVWLLNFNHVYLAHECLDLGKTQIEPHGHGWPITTSIAHWSWTCE